MSTLTVKNLQGVAPTNRVTIPAGQTLYAPGHVLQVVNYTTTTSTSSSATIPWDNTIPQNTEGVECLSVSITPKSADSKLFFNVLFNGYSTVENTYGLILALFQSGVSGALSAQIFSVSNSNYYARNLQYYMTAGVTSTLTFSIRVGSGSTGTVYINPNSLMGGVGSSTITIMEIAQ